MNSCQILFGATNISMRFLLGCRNFYIFIVKMRKILLIVKLVELYNTNLFLRKFQVVNEACQVSRYSLLLLAYPRNQTLFFRMQSRELELRGFDIMSDVRIDTVLFCNERSLRQDHTVNYRRSFDEKEKNLMQMRSLRVNKYIKNFTV